LLATLAVIGKVFNIDAQKKKRHLHATRFFFVFVPLKRDILGIKNKIKMTE